jgi:hypothetical protein
LRRRRAAAGPGHSCSHHCLPATCSG